MRFNITRTGSLRYYLSKFCSAFLCGGSAVLFGYIIFGVIVRIIFPSLSQYELSADDLSFVLVNNKDELTGVLRYMLSAFLYGAISTMPALEMVRMASKSKIGRFNKQDIRELCPTLSDSSIEGALRKLVAAGELKKEGKGKSTCYFRLN